MSNEQLSTFQRAIDEAGVGLQRREFAFERDAADKKLAGLEARAS